MTSTMGLQQQAASQDTVDFAGYLQSAQCHHGNQTAEGQNCQKSPRREHNSSFTSTKGLLNGPGQNNCFLNSAVQVREFYVPLKDQKIKSNQISSNTVACCVESLARNVFLEWITPRPAYATRFSCTPPGRFLYTFRRASA